MELMTKLGRSQCGVPSANTIFRSFRPGSLRDSRPKPCRQEPWSKSSGNNSGANWAHSSTNARRRSASCQISSYCWRIMGMTICLAPRGACGGGVFRSRFTCRVFGRASILASPYLERSRMTKMPPDGYPAFQYLQSVGVRNPGTGRAATKPPPHNHGWPVPLFAGHMGLSSKFNVKRSEFLRLKGVGGPSTACHSHDKALFELSNLFFVNDPKYG